METEADTAKTFWSEVDVDGVFDELMEVLRRLRHTLRHNTATDREYVQAMRIVQESKLIRTETEDVLLDEDILTVTVSEPQCSPESLQNGIEPEDPQHSRARLYSDVGVVCSHMSSSRPDPAAPLVFQPHVCSSACVPHLPAHTHHLLGHNPLRAPLLCHFQRVCDDAGVVYKAPCGRSLSCMQEVLHFLLQTQIVCVLQTDHFSFSTQVCVERQVCAAPLLERDLSRGLEPVPVALVNTVDGARPREFRYRRERWPHGCFLSAEPLYSVCCDCTDGCTDAHSCACVRRTAGAAYTHQRLTHTLRTGLFECGPWCGCERSCCENRVVQKGLRVRLQVFRTPEHRWAVRCRDDLDAGTFICIYAGVVLRLQQSSECPAERSGEPAVSDDEVQLVEEWRIPEETHTHTHTLDSSPPLHVPVIQRPAEHSLAQRRDQQQFSISSETEDNLCEQALRKKPRLMESNGLQDSRTHTLTHTHDGVYYLDASREGNVARFFTHSDDPNLFIQNVFTDTHDPQFPLIAFFTCRPVKAGTELTWSCTNTEQQKTEEKHCSV